MGDPSVPPFFAVVFNFMGLWPLWYAATLTPGAGNQKPVPALPFLIVSVAFGMFAISPYLALREYRPSGIVKGNLNTITLWFEGKINAILLLAGAVALCGYGLTANDGDLVTSATEYKELFDSQLFVHVTSLDFLSLWALSFGVMVEDSKRRGANVALAPAFSAVPILGHCLYLLLRPPLPEE